LCSALCLSGRSAYEVSYPFCRLSQECSWRCWIHGNFIHICLFICQLRIFLCTISTISLIYIYTYTHMFVHNWWKVLPPIMLDSHKICCWLTQPNCCHAFCESQPSKGIIWELGMKDSVLYLDPWSFPLCILKQTNRPCTLACKQGIDVLNGIAWDKKTARLFGEWIFSGYILDIWFLPAHGSDYWDWFTGSACKWRDFGMM
jgi:hypothetical protein